MIKIMFVCHGNICRSPMAEYVFKDIVKREGVAENYHIVSRATSTEELGNGVHYGTKQVLNRLGIDCSEKRSQLVSDKECDEYDYLIAMDGKNLRNLSRMLSSSNMQKVMLLLDYAGSNRDVADPWYTGDFDTTYQDVLKGCKAVLEHTKKMY